MCGIFGVIVKPNSDHSSDNIASALKGIAKLSESRGKDSAGVAFRNANTKTIEVIKGDVPITKLLKSKEYKEQLNNCLKSYNEGDGFAAFGHARLVTNGSQLNEENNQPVLKDNIVLIHNGIIVNVDELWDKNPGLQRKFLIDTEIIPSLIRRELGQQNDLVNACNKAFDQIEGTFSIAAMFHDLDQFVLATNNGSLFYITDNTDFLVFASERFYLERLKLKTRFFNKYKEIEIEQIISNTGLIINLKTLKISHFDISHSNSLNPGVCSILPYTLHKRPINSRTP